MNRIIILTDYKGIFGSKWNAVPYRSGMDLEIIKRHFSEKGYKVEIMSFSDIANTNESFKNSRIIYTSTEDIKYHYKDFIEDVVCGLEANGAVLIPSFKFLRATNNKVLMEILRKEMNIVDRNPINAHVYGSYEDILKEINKLKFPLVIKEAAGAMSRGVSLVNNQSELKRRVVAISKTPGFKTDLKDKLRALRHPDYTLESRHRRKFIVQEFIPNLQNDWKILIFGHKYFIFSRPVRKNDFRASGSGAANYIFGNNCTAPEGIFDFARKIFERINTPHLSIDIVYDGKSFYLIEFQVVHFGTVGVVKSNGYYRESNNKWEFVKSQSHVEEVFVDSIDLFLKRGSFVKE